MPLSSAMTNPVQNPWLVGVDGCKGGWVAAFMRPDGTDAHVHDVFSEFCTLLDGSEPLGTVAIDIPIGFPAHSRGGRAPDNAVRKLLNKGGSSVYPMPSRSAVFAERAPFSSPKKRRLAHQRACAVAEETSTPSKRVTIFSFGLFPKIQQVDAVLKSNPSAKQFIFETHPEVAFWKLNNETSLDESKKTDAGKNKRRQILISAGLPPSLVNSKPPKGAQTDDLLDALVSVVVARRIREKTAKCFPADPEIDEELGLPMAIWA